MLAQTAQHDRAAFTVVYQRYVKRVYAYLYSRVGTVEDAQDLTTITFMTALEQLPTYRGEGTLAAWLLGIAYRKSVDFYRKTPLSMPLDRATALADPSPIPDVVVLQQFQRQELESALRRLTPERAEAIALRFFGELSNGEVAKVMNKQEAAVKMLIYRGLQELRVRLGIREESV
ncbi:MAG: RNA polymerase sigma factor [Caldilineaceae bacterium]|nr:RNA polymerase sigma factor [Caldilineaceae bacterium]